MKKVIGLVILITAILILMMGYSQAASPEDNNPIDKVFDKDFEKAANTNEFNYVTDKYLDAWKAEMKNAAFVAKKAYKFKEDRQRIDEYIALYEKLGRKAFDLEMLNWSDTSQPQGVRNFGTGGPGAAMMAEAKIYKQATLNLIEHIKGPSSDAVYKYKYYGKGAELEKIRKP